MHILDDLRWLLLAYFLGPMEDLRDWWRRR